MNHLIIVSNNSPITSLAAVGKLDLLKNLDQRIIIPETVDTGEAAAIARRDRSVGGSQKPGFFPLCLVTTSIT